MSDAGGEGLKEEICKQLFLGKEKGEDEHHGSYHFV